MPQARGLVPYAALAVLVVGATVVALLTFTLGTPVAAPATLEQTPAASATGHARTDLSRNGRLAYWRTEPNGETLLWLANADNSRRRSVAKADPRGSIAKTRWAVDGSAVAYVDSGVRLAVVAVDGGTTTWTLPPEARAARDRIVDHHFSPSGERIAATVQRQSGSQSDVYVTNGAGGWTRLTTTEDVLAADWISEDELLVQTTGGIIGRLRATGTDQLRPITGLAGATPLVGDDGRVYFLSGRVSPFTSANETFVAAGAASVWSMTLAGDDVRRETGTLGTDGFRLDGFWPAGGFLVHRGTNTGQVVMGRDGAIELPRTAGVIERLDVSLDHRVGVGHAGTNLLRVDIAPTGTVASVVVLLGAVVQADAWFPRTGVVADAPQAKAAVPAARFAFALGGHLWTTDVDGVPRLLRAGNTNAQTLRRFALPPPRWSPAGDRLLTVESLSTGAASQQLVAVTIGRDGAARRYTTPSSVGVTATWSPDGLRFAVVGLPAGPQDPAVLASELEVVLVDAASGSTATVPGREAWWTEVGVVVLSNGTYRSGDLARDEQAIELWDAGRRTTITTVAALVAATPPLAGAAPARGTTQTSALIASADGRYAAMQLLVLGRTTPLGAFIAFRASDGVPSVIVAGDTVGDAVWSPRGPNIGYTRVVGTGAAAPRRAIVRDAEDGDVLLDVEGRFAGWSPDGEWVYVARSEGLFARRLSGDDLVRFAPYGVPVSAVTP